MKKVIAAMLALVMVLALAAGCTQQGGGVKDVDIKQVHEKVKEAYGENYLPSAELDKDTLVATTGVKAEDIEEFVAEAPMMSAQVDTFIAIKAVKDKGADVETALNAYRDRLVSDTMMYPMNQPKVEASQVVRHGDYVFFVLLGAYEDVPDGSDPTVDFAKNEVKKGVDAINGMFQ